MQAFASQPRSKYVVPARAECFAGLQSWSWMEVAGWTTQQKRLYSETTNAAVKHLCTPCISVFTHQAHTGLLALALCSVLCAHSFSWLCRWRVKTVLLRCRGFAAAGRFKFHCCTFTRSDCRLSAKGSLAFSIRPTRWLSSHRSSQDCDVHMDGVQRRTMMLRLVAWLKVGCLAAA